ncbi:MAG: hypothetical protein GX868_10315, partial [Actinobacteria bacterium]|nr:hypothetical protein [Actinomycetota bacterium]
MLRFCDKARGMVTPRRARRADSRLLRFARAVTYALLLALLVAPLARSAAAQTPEAAAVDLAEAAAIREAADERVLALTDELARVDAEAADSFAESEQLADELEGARADLRAAVVEAYVSDGIHDPLISYLLEPDAATASARRTYLQHRAGDRRDAAVRFESLKKGNDPRLVELVNRREALAARLASATDAAQQARANEADAERFVVQAKERADAERVAAERSEAERVASERAAAERAAEERAAVPDSKRVNPGGAPKVAPATPTTPTTPEPAPTPPRPAPIVPRDGLSAPLPILPEGGPTEEQWAALRDCESGNNYRIVSASGRYRGAYQFDVRTWETLGGVGDPAEALPIEQDARAKLLYFRRGTK